MEPQQPGVPPQGQLPHRYPPQPVPVLSPSSSKKKLFVVVGVVAIVVAIAGAAFFFMHRSKDAALGTTKPVALPSADGLTAEKVAALDKEGTFWGYFENAAQQQKLITVHENYTAKTADEKPAYIDYYKVGFDYQTKQFAAAHDELDVSRKTRYKTRCVDGKEYYNIGVGNASWREPKAGDTTLCSLDDLSYRLTEGVNTGGLTAEQAKAFIDYVRRWQGLTHVTDLKLVEKNGKKYLHYTFEITPIATEGSYVGNQYLLWGFKKSGNDSNTYPYAYAGAFGGGLHLEYYVDPASKLPVYSEVTELPYKDNNGKDVPLDEYSKSRTLYQFGAATFDTSISNEANITFDW